MCGKSADPPWRTESISPPGAQKYGGAALLVEIPKATVIPFSASRLSFCNTLAPTWRVLGAFYHTASFRPYFPGAPHRDISSSLKDAPPKSKRPVFRFAASLSAYPIRVYLFFFASRAPLTARSHLGKRVFPRALHPGTG